MGFFYLAGAGEMKSKNDNAEFIKQFRKKRILEIWENLEIKRTIKEYIDIVNKIKEDWGESNSLKEYYLMQYAIIDTLIFKRLSEYNLDKSVVMEMTTSEGGMFIAGLMHQKQNSKN
jgi:hypothetical protein